MGQLTNQYVSSSYQGLLKMTDSTQGLTNTLQTIQTGDGDNSPLQMSLTEVNISGSFFINNVPITNGTNGTSGTSGVNGSSGTSGTAGSSGSSGTAGTSGSSGSSGTSGSNGSSGTSGSNGSSGTSGAAGVSGSSGTSGTSGSAGTSGTSGATGSNGTSGTSGVSGSSGTSGTSGISGSSGTSGTAGTSGTSGDSLFAQTGSYWATTNDLQVTGSLIVTGGITGSITDAENARDIVLYVKNTTGLQIDKGKVVRITGSTGDNALIALADWTDDNNSANTLGFVNDNIANDAFGYVTTNGTFIGLNTSGMTAGDMLYLSSSGNFTNVIPPAPYHEVRLGQVLRPQQNNGSAYVSVINGFELTELHDVDITNPVVGDLLVYRSGSYGQWVNETGAELGFATTGSNTFVGNQNITGSLIQSGSNSLMVAPGGNGAGTWIKNRVVISDIPGGDTPRLWISGSDGAYTEFGRGFIAQDTTKVAGLDANIYTVSNVANNSQNIVAVYNDDFSTDVELQMFANSGSIGFADWDNGSTFSYVPFMTVAPNVGDNPVPQFTRGLGVTGSLLVNGQPVVTGSVSADRNGLITTGSIGTTQAITSSLIVNDLIVSGNFVGNDINKGLIKVKTEAYESGSIQFENYITASAPISQSNFIFGTAGPQNAALSGTTIISGSNNIILGATRGSTLAQGTFGYIQGNNNIINSIPTISTSSFLNANLLTSNNNTFNAVVLFDAPSSGSITDINYFNNISNNYIGSVQTIRHKSGSIILQNNSMQGSVTSFATQSVLFGTGSVNGPQVTGNVHAGSATTLLHASSSIVYSNNFNNTGQFRVTNHATAPASTNTSGSIVVSNNIFGGASNNVLLSGSGVQGQRSVSNNISIGTANELNVINSGSVGHLANTAILGQGLIVSGNLPATTAGGSTIVGRYNATGSNQETINETVFVVGTGTAPSARRNALHIDNSNNTRITGSVFVSGSFQVNGANVLAGTTGLITTGSLMGSQTISGSLLFNSSIGQAIIIENGDFIMRTGSIISKGSGDVVNNMALGEDALFSNQNVMGGGYNNTAIGYNAMYNTTTGATNTAIGANALLENVSGSSNVAIGDNALRNSKSGGNVAIGSTTLFQQTIGQNNLGIGSNALRENVSGSNNVAIGTNVLQNNKANQNTGIGGNVLSSNTTGVDNVGIGYSSLQQNTIGVANMAIGNQSQVANVSGSRNVAIGNSALYNNFASDNTAIGSDALGQNTVGSYNIGIGTEALNDLVDGSSNIGIGYNVATNMTNGVGNVIIGDIAAWNLVSGSYNVIIGNKAGYNIGNDDRQFYLAHKDFGSLNGDRSGSLMWGQFNDTTVSQSLQINAKTNIQNVMNLQPQATLPTGVIGDLAVSGSNLFFYNGAWTQVI